MEPTEKGPSTVKASDPSHGIFLGRIGCKTLFSLLIHSKILAKHKPCTVYSAVLHSPFPKIQNQIFPLPRDHLLSCQVVFHSFKLDTE